MIVTSKSYKAALFSLFLMGVTYAADEPIALGVANQNDLPVIFGEESTDNHSVFYRAEKDSGGQLGVVMLSAPHIGKFNLCEGEDKRVKPVEAHKAFFEALAHFIVHCARESEASDRDEDVEERVKSIFCDVSQLQESRDSREKQGDFLQSAYRAYPAEIGKVVAFLERGRTFSKSRISNSDLWERIAYRGIIVAQEEVHSFYKNVFGEYVIEEEEFEMQKGFLLGTGSLYVDCAIMSIFKQAIDKRKAEGGVDQLFEEVECSHPVYAIVDIEKVRENMAEKQELRSPNSRAIIESCKGKDEASDDSSSE